MRLNDAVLLERGKSCLSLKERTESERESVRENLLNA